ncbi:MAG: CRTAC1 family protein [SAR324 cluster bacterium]|nr:CRTAC1 family protein [SAR324 cluster bacterium]
MKRLLKIILIAIPVLILIMGVVISALMIKDSKIDYDVSTQGIDIPKFTEVEIPFDQQLNDNESLPFMGSAIIDVDNDGVEELFLGGGPGQEDAIFKYVDGQFLNIAVQTKLTKSILSEATFGASVIDVDKNGFSDLILSRTNGIWLYKNKGGMFSAEKLNISLKEDTSPLSVAISDINRDGHFDLYVAGYIKKEQVAGQTVFTEGYGGTSAMLLNNGDNTFTDITKKSGLYYKHNTFMGLFVDVDNDGFEDLVVAHDTGHVKTWKNRGNGTFQDMPNPDTKRYSYPMGIGVTDYNNDGLVDFFFSNIGSTLPMFMVRGDLRDDQVLNSKWMLFKNRGNFAFDDVANQVKIANYEFSWGGIFEDFNLDGHDDLVVSENYSGLPTYKIPYLRSPGRFLLQNKTEEFAAVGEQSGVKNKYYGITPLTADFNQDGYPDLVHVNLMGRSKAFLSKGGKARYLKVVLPDIITSIAAKIIVKLDNGNTLYRDFVSGEGLCSDQSHIQIFGLGEATATKISIKYINGTHAFRAGSFANQTVTF